MCVLWTNIWRGCLSSQEINLVNKIEKRKRRRRYVHPLVLMIEVIEVYIHLNVRMEKEKKKRGGREGVSIVHLREDGHSLPSSSTHLFMRERRKKERGGRERMSEVCVYVV
ncbi:hypothetical protein CSUI_008066 [Cystoisospora suis]|uniref:Uncharacterized protein n=1 Tax=Cystoisospora suis TaxID=483139 RepID=A0A2C6KNQ8_9APIC|nr:hypothetical protein CSUI_008066 [Cystoisospora suis]